MKAGTEWSGYHSRVSGEQAFQFEWDEVKAASNLRKHGVTFELASTVFLDPRILTVADLAHSEIEERWFAIGLAGNGVMLSIVYLWWESGPGLTKVRLISARPATRNEARQYEGTL
ncbi:MAG: BrnT family toxin [Bryobacteraceae bacterium]